MAVPNRLTDQSPTDAWPLVNQNFDELDTSVNSFKFITVITGTHTVTNDEITAKYAKFSFPHNLGYQPNVIGTALNSNDTIARPMPVLWRGNISYYGGPVIASASINIESIDTTNINCRFDIFDLTGFSWILFDSVLHFKFYCFRQPTVTS